MANLRTAKPFEDELLAFVRRNEEAMLKASRKWVESVGEAMPVDVPAAHRMVDGVFDFTERVLKTQREFAHRMIRQTRHTATRRTTTTRRPTAGARPSTARRPTTTAAATRRPTRRVA